MDLANDLRSVLPSKATPIEPRIALPLAVLGISQVQRASLLTKRCVRARSALPATDALQVTCPLSRTAPVSLRAAASRTVYSAPALGLPAVNFLATSRRGAVLTS